MIKILDEEIKLHSLNKKTIKMKNGGTRNHPGYNEFIDQIYFFTIGIKDKIKQPYVIHIIASTWKDVTNYEKPILDGLELAGVIKNDSLVYRLISDKIPIKKNGKEKLQIFIDNYKR